MAKKRRGKVDANETAFRVVQQATGETELTSSIGTEPPEKNPAAVELGRRGGLKGGKARAEKLNAAERSQIAAKAAAARWSKRKAD
jgi:hypothetical protein